MSEPATHLHSSATATELWIGRTLSGLAIAFFVMDAAMKLLALPIVVTTGAQLGFQGGETLARSRRHCNARASRKSLVLAYAVWGLPWTDGVGRSLSACAALARTVAVATSQTLTNLGQSALPRSRRLRSRLGQKLARR